MFFIHFDKNVYPDEVARLTELLDIKVMNEYDEVVIPYPTSFHINRQFFVHQTTAPSIFNELLNYWKQFEITRYEGTSFNDNTGEVTAIDTIKHLTTEKTAGEIFDLMREDYFYLEFYRDRDGTNQLHISSMRD